jgi:hypothetical protein
MLKSYDYRQHFTREEILHAVETLMPSGEAEEFVEALYSVSREEEILLSPVIATAIARLSPECAT